jgi:hypothetical protein
LQAPVSVVFSAQSVQATSALERELEQTETHALEPPPAPPVFPQLSGEQTQPANASQAALAGPAQGTAALPAST